MSTIVVSADFLLNSNEPATGLTLSDIDLTLVSVRKSDEATTTIWNTENPTTEVPNMGTYVKSYTSADLETYWYYALGVYDGTTILNSNTVRGEIGEVGIDINDRVNIGEWLSQAVTLSPTNVPDVNMLELSDDATAAANLEAMFDGTGYTDDEAPAKQIQLSQLTNTGAAVNTPAESYVLTTGTQVSGTFANTAALDGVYHQHSDTAGVMELYYEFDIGGDGIPTSCQVTGRINGSNDTLDGVYAWNWNTTTWDRIGDFVGQTSTVDVVRSYDLYTTHVGMGANLGKVRIRFYAAAGLTSANLYIDQMFTAYSIVTRTVGYENGAIWIDTVNGTAGSTVYVNGTADNPVDNLADAILLATTLNLHRFEVIAGSTITFTESHDSETWDGNNWTLNLGTQSISGTTIRGANLSGVCTGAIRPKFENCTFGTVTIPPCRINSGSGFSGTLTLGSAGNFDIINCTSLIAGLTTPIIDVGAGVAGSNISLRNWSGGINFLNIESGDVISLEGWGGVITVNGSGGAIHIRGIFQGVVDNTSDAVSIFETAVLNRQALSGYAEGAVWVDTVNGVSGTRDYVNGTQINPVDNLTDAYTIMASVGLSNIQVESRSALTLPSDSSYKTFKGQNYTLALNNQNIEGSVFDGVTSLSGTGLGGTFTVPPTFLLCGFGNVTLPPCNGLDCGFFGTFTIGSAGNYTFGESGSVFDITPIFDFGAGLNASQLFLGWKGGCVEIQNAGAGTGTYKFEVFGFGDVIINANCSDTLEVVLRGHVNLVNNSAVTTIEQEVNYSGTNVNTEVLDVMTVDTFPEPSSVPLATASIEAKLAWLTALSRNKGTQTTTLKTLRNDADTGNIATATVSDASGVFTRDEYT
jgi:hypothetical protein